MVFGTSDSYTLSILEEVSRVAQDASSKTFAKLLAGDRNAYTSEIQNILILRTNDFSPNAYSIFELVDVGSDTSDAKTSIFVEQVAKIRHILASIDVNPLPIGALQTNQGTNSFIKYIDKRVDAVQAVSSESIVVSTGLAHIVALAKVIVLPIRTGSISNTDEVDEIIAVQAGLATMSQWIKAGARQSLLLLLLENASLEHSVDINKRRVIRAWVGVSLIADLLIVALLHVVEHNSIVSRANREEVFLNFIRTLVCSCPSDHITDSNVVILTSNWIGLFKTKNYELVEDRVLRYCDSCLFFEVDNFVYGLTDNITNFH